MKIIIRIIFIFLLVSFFGCSKKDNKDLTSIKSKELDLQMIDAYKDGLKELEKGDPIYAARKFNEAELLYPQSKWAPRSSLMAAYTYYSYFYYDDAIYELTRFLKTYKNHERTDYAYYLLGIAHYEKIVDEKRDLQSLIEAKKNFKIVIKNYPNTDFALDSKYKLDVINEILASKEMYIAKHYVQKEKWIPAINRYKKILSEYETTIYVEEALHRLVELHYKVGLTDESKKYASLLGYNYQSSKWYEESYKIFNKKYKKKVKKKKDKKDSILKRMKSLLD